MSVFTPRQALFLILLTISWGVNWPVMKLGVTDVPALTFRAMSIWVGVPILLLIVLMLKVPLRIPRAHWRELFWLTFTNMLVWHTFAILGVAALSSGRAAILGYTMPVFSAVIGWWLFQARLTLPQTLGVLAAAGGVSLLLWHEFARLAGAPLGAGMMVMAAAVWAYGTQRLRRTTIPAHTLTLTVWMVTLTGVLLALLALVFESSHWVAPTPTAWAAIAYNGVVIFGFVHAAWFFLARTLPPIASTLSVMMIPVLGVLSGAWWLGERLFWQDWAAMVLLAAAIASVLWPTRSGPAAATASPEPVRPPAGPSASARSGTD